MSEKFSLGLSQTNPEDGTNIFPMNPTILIIRKTYMTTPNCNIYSQKETQPNLNYSKNLSG
ncbi:MAG: hypothetical protein CO127_03410 [Ignavibacteria bacterium CG_4_9_14_3_um_filter_36_18]|nr:MAG: hypothetical protein CO127_03410 [Ignavibacteria bacterium CG_4_9_14_3_um_filter_36_18]